MSTPPLRVGMVDSGNITTQHAIFTSLETMPNADNFDVIAICLLHPLHTDAVIAAETDGKAVYPGGT